VRAEIEDVFDDAGVAEPVTVSIGVAHGSRLTAKEELLRLADKKLYEAKEAGRNIVLGESHSHRKA
jgi:GGDEF domain-containing protein